MLRDNPVLQMLGRRGRGAVVDALRAAPERTWSVRELARAADVPVAAASRAVHELAALGVVDSFRPGRNQVIRWEPDSAVAQALAPFVVPDLRQESAVAFAKAFARAGRLVRWSLPGDDLGDPLCPTRVAILVRGDEDGAWDLVGPALDAVEAAGWPKPSITVHRLRDLTAGDEVSDAISRGRILVP